MGVVTPPFMSCPLGKPESLSRWAMFCSLSYSLADILCFQMLRSSSLPPPSSFSVYVSMAPCRDYQRREMAVRYPCVSSGSGPEVSVFAVAIISDFTLTLHFRIPCHPASFGWLLPPLASHFAGLSNDALGRGRGGPKTRRGLLGGRHRATPEGLGSSRVSRGGGAKVRLRGESGGGGGAVRRRDRGVSRRGLGAATRGRRRATRGRTIARARGTGTPRKTVLIRGLGVTQTHCF